MKRLIAVLLLFSLFSSHSQSQTTNESPFHVGLEMGWFWNTGNVQIESANGFLSKNPDLVDYRKLYGGINFSYHKPRYALELSVSQLSNIISTSYGQKNATVGSTRTYIYVPVRYYRHFNLFDIAALDVGLGVGPAFYSGSDNADGQQNSTLTTEVNGVTQTVKLSITESIVNRSVFCAEPTLRLRFKTGKNHDLCFSSRYIHSFSDTRSHKYNITMGNQPPQLGSSRTSLSGFALGASFIWHFKKVKSDKR
jgi:hypothetical protein